MKRKILSVSLSYQNPDAIIVARRLSEIPEGQRSAALLKWAAAFLNGMVIIAGQDPTAEVISDDEFDKLLDNL